MLHYCCNQVDPSQIHVLGWNQQVLVPTLHTGCFHCFFSYRSHFLKNYFIIFLSFLSKELKIFTYILTPLPFSSHTSARMDKLQNSDCLKFIQWSLKGFGQTIPWVSTAHTISGNNLVGAVHVCAPHGRSVGVFHNIWHLAEDKNPIVANCTCSWMLLFHSNFSYLQYLPINIYVHEMAIATYF